MRQQIAVVLVAALVGACGSKPPPPPSEPVSEETKGARKPGGPTPQISQELGSIDQRKVEQTFAGLQTGQLETCHKQGRDRIEFLTGDVKVFLRIDGSGRVRYSYFEDTSIGDRETEKCILGVFGSTTWPKPEGGEAEVRSGFGWSGGGEREPTHWPSDKVAAALVEAKDVKKAIDKCKAGVKGDFHVTGYVEVDESGHTIMIPRPTEETSARKGKPAAKPATKKPAGKPAAASPSSPKDPVGRFKAVGMSAPNKEAAEKVDCMVDALKGLELPSPGSYAAKVTFSL